jgi:uncharacterized membrane protein
MQSHDEAGSPVVSRSRLEFLFDGIFAIAMTLLVLDLHVPQIADRHATRELAGELVRELPIFGSYLLSFFVLGMFWYRHNHQFRFVRRITRPMLALHLVQMACAAFFPFCASLIGRYPTNALSLVFYAGCTWLYIVAGLLNWMAAHSGGALAHELPETEYLRMRKRQLRGCIAVTGVLALSFAQLAIR